MRRKSIHKQILRNQLLLSVITIIMIYLSAYLILYFTMMHNANQRLESNIQFIDNYVDSFFKGYEEKWSIINANQDLRNYIVHSNEISSYEETHLFYTSIEYMFNFSDETSLNINNLTQQVFPPTNTTIPNNLAEHLKNDTTQNIFLSEDSSTLNYALGLYNFTETDLIGSVNFAIPIENFISYFDNKVPTGMTIAIYDHAERIIYTTLTNDLHGYKEYFLTKEKSSEKTGLKIYAVLNTQSELDNLYRFGMLLLPIIIIILLINIFLSYNISAKIVFPIKSLIASIKRAEQGDITYSHPFYDLEEIEDLSQSYDQMINKINHLMEKNHKINLLKVESQLSALQQKIDPHFLFNTLELISSQAVLEDAKSTSVMTQKLGNLFRYNLRAPDTISLGRELKYIKDYLYLQKIRFDHELMFEFNICEDISHYKVPQLTLQPLIENCIKHGFNDLGSEEYRISIKTTKSKNNIYIIVHDNGKGIKPDSLKEINNSIHMDVNNFQYFISRKEHIGLRNVNARLCLQYRIKTALKVYSKVNKGTTIVIKLPEMKDQ
ncbi:sensor histidine kinase [Vallitalea okinawensis]|uniref:sensor histidine kinase n=1 Tax=Vallitalea okinawensis TaxID=2078660 RepID=UPI000CFD6AC1|nr:histidine kinase [Vallitalea okinawensis]